MYDSVESGTYKFDADSASATPATITAAPAAVNSVVVTVQIDAVGVSNYPVKASSDDVAVATVSPPLGFTTGNGTVSFSVTAVADGEATITFTAGTETDTTVVTVATP
jgi:hypothetical protein